MHRRAVARTTGSTLRSRQARAAGARPAASSSPEAPGRWRFLTGLAVAWIIACLAGCSVGGSVAPDAAGSAGAAPGAARSTPPPVQPASPQEKAAARTAAARFYGLYAAADFGELWHLLAPAAKREIPRRVWVRVHVACRADAMAQRTIEQVTVFGNAAIITESVGGPTGHGAEDVFNEINGRWAFSPPDPGIYERGSAAAAISAARAAGWCASWKVF